MDSLSRAPRSAMDSWPATAGAGDHLLPPDPSLPIRASAEPEIEHGHAYSLPELIDLAESSNPETRIGWERARQAALAVGIAKAEYLPTISALAIGGYQHSSFPVPNIPAPALSVAAPPIAPSASFPLPQGGRVGVDTYELLPFIAIRWQLLDFGREPSIRAAEHTSNAANSLFTGAHQKIVYEVTRAYFQLSAARAQVTVARESLDRTRSIARSAEARFDRGLATQVDIVQARREVAQAEYSLAEAQATETSVYSTLLAAMGIEPSTALEVATRSSGDLPQQIERPLDDFVQLALRTRPDLQAALAQRSAAQAQVDKTDASFLPRISVTGTAGSATLGAHIDGAGTHSATIPNAGVALTFDWLLFDGGVRQAGGGIARSRRNEAEHELVKMQHTAMSDVISAYNEANASLVRYRAAQALEGNAAVAEDAVLKSYRNGLSTFSDAASAQRSHFQASAAKEQAFAQAVISATALTFASGQLGTADHALLNGGR